MSSGRDEWMAGWSAEDKARNLQGVTGKKYEQLEFDFFTPEDPFAFLGASDEVLNRKCYDALRKREEATNYIHQANAIIKLVMDNIGEGGRDHDNHEFALWGATELLQKSVEMLE